jgi:ABC-type glycerol-3-phosphate transport system permease component
MNFNCPNCSLNLKYKILKITRKKKPDLWKWGGYGCLLCPGCGAKLERNNKNPSDKFIYPLPLLLPLVMGAYILESTTLRIVSGGAAILIAVFTGYAIIKFKGVNETAYKQTE